MDDIIYIVMYIVCVSICNIQYVCDCMCMFICSVSGRHLAKHGCTTKKPTNIPLTSGHVPMCTHPFLKYTRKQLRQILSGCSFVLDIWVCLEIRYTVYPQSMVFDEISSGKKYGRFFSNVNQEPRKHEGIFMEKIVNYT